MTRDSHVVTHDPASHWSRPSANHDSPVTRVGSHAEPGLDLPHLDGLVPAAAQDVVTGGEEGHAAHVVVVAMHRLDALVRLEVP